MLEGYPGTRIGNVEDRCWGRVCAQEFAETGFGLFARVGVAWEDLNTRTGEVFGPDDGPEFADTRLDGALRHGFVDEEQNAAMPEGEEVIHALANTVGIVHPDIGVTTLRGKGVNVDHADTMLGKHEVEGVREMARYTEQENAEVRGRTLELTHGLRGMCALKRVVNTDADILALTVIKQAFENRHEEDRIASRHHDANFLRLGRLFLNKGSAGHFPDEQAFVG